MNKNTYVKGENAANSKDITIETGSTSKIYDGTPLSYDNLSIVSGELNVRDELVCDTTKPVSSITNAGSISNVLTPKIIDSATSEDHTTNYNITVNYGTLTVNKHPVTLTSSNYSLVRVGFMGFEIKQIGDNTVSIEGMGFINNEVTSVEPHKFNNILTMSTGTYGNKPITINWADGANPNNYDITYKYGTVTKK